MAADNAAAQNGRPVGRGYQCLVSYGHHEPMVRDRQRPDARSIFTQS
jgi:hypothetical protein